MRGAKHSARGRRDALRLCGLLLGLLAMAGCAGTSLAPAVVDSGQAQPGIRGYKVGKPYHIKGVWYYPQVDYGYIEDGVASWYGPGFDGRATANGETYDMNDLTAAHRTLPMPSIVRVTNLENGRNIRLRVNDRGPFVGERIIDVSRRGAQLLGFHMNGTARVRVEILEDESRQLLAAMGGSTAETAAYRAPVAPLIAPAVIEPAVIEPAAISPPEIGSVPAAMQLPTPIEVAEAPPPLPGDGVLLASAVQIADLAAPSMTGRGTYVQAGAFADPARADRARQRLTTIGPVVMSPSLVGGRELLRVRVGPLPADVDADRLLASVGEAGFPDCRLVVVE